MLSSADVHGQSFRDHEQGGRPFGMHQFQGKELPNEWQNWSVAQDNRGVIYVANHAGVLEYDGAEWRLVKVAESNTAFSIASDSTGRIYVGSREEFGYLVPDSAGTMIYKSLMDQVNPNDLGFGIVWNTAVTSKGVFFQSHHRLFRWDGEQIDVWSSDVRMHTSFVVHDDFYVRKDSIGLLSLQGNAFQLIPGGEKFAHKRVFFMAPSGEQVFIASQEGLRGSLELDLYNGEELVSLEVDEHFRNISAEYTYYTGVVLASGYYGLSSLYDGLFIVDKNGHIIESLDDERGISEDINFAFRDAQGGLWLAHNRSGITYLPAPFGLSEYGKGEGLPASVNAVLRYQNRLFVATDEGLFRLNNRIGGKPEDDINSQFEQVIEADSMGAKGHFWSLLDRGHELLIASEYGVFRLREEKIELIGFGAPDMEMPSTFFPSAKDENKVYVALKNGLGLLEWSGNSWRARKLRGFNKKVNSLYEEADGSLWLGTATPGSIWKVELDEAGNLREETRVTDSKTLDSPFLTVENLNGKVAILAAPKGIFRPISTESGYSVVLDEDYPHGFDRPDSTSEFIDLVSVDPYSYWALYTDKVESVKIINGEHINTELPAELLLPDWGGFRNIFVEDNDVVWVNSTNYRPMLKYDSRIRASDRIDTAYMPLVRRLTILGSDSVLYGGAFSALTAPGKFKKGRLLDLDLSHKDNDLKFEFAIPHFNRQAQVAYQYKLDGHDKNWSNWTSETSVIYRNIDYGDLTFEVKARVGSEPIDGVATVIMTVYPPWFWSWWMKIFYLVFFGYSVSQFVRYQQAKKQIALLNIQRELNGRLQLANSQLRSANESLEQANRMKDEFLANASHELRTPLTAILGFTSVLKEEVPEENLEFLGLIDENGKRLLQTINSLLDLAKLRAGMLDLNFEQLDIGEKTEEVVDLLTQLAKNRDLSLEVERPVEQIRVRLDAHCYERILYNLIGNAIKFTRKGGVTVRVERKEDEVLVQVIDTGIGIDENFLPLLFDEFKQEPNNEVRSDGSGLGLTITAKLVELLNGQIGVVSKKGTGSTFTVSFRIDEIKWAGRHTGDGTHAEQRTHSAIR